MERRLVGSRISYETDEFAWLAYLTQVAVDGTIRYTWWSQEREMTGWLSGWEIEDGEMIVCSAGLSLEELIQGAILRGIILDISIEEPFRYPDVPEPVASALGIISRS